MIAQFESYQMEITTSENNQTLLFNETEVRSGYFSSGYNLSLLGTFSFTKSDGTLDNRTINHTVSDIQIATHYIVNVDFTLQNGEINFTLVLDDSYTEEVIELGDGNTGTSYYIPNAEPVITSLLNDFIGNSNSDYSLTWQTVPNATHYTIYTGSDKNNLSLHQDNLTSTSSTINLTEGANFFKVEAHFSAGETTDYLGGTFRKFSGTPNAEYANLFTELAPLGEISSNDNSIINTEDILFEANDNFSSPDGVSPTRNARLYLNNNYSNGKVVDVTSGGINEEIDINDGGLYYYYYSGKENGTGASFTSKYDDYQYFSVFTNPEDDTMGLYQEFNPRAIRIYVGNYNWGIGTPYFYIERREFGTSTWVNINSGWSTSIEIYDYTVDPGVTYEYRYKVSLRSNGVSVSDYSTIASITAPTN